MYQEDMMNEADGCGGLPPTPKVTVIEKTKPERNNSVAGNSGSSRGEGKGTGAVERPYDHNDLFSDHEVPAYQPPLHQQDPRINQPDGYDRSSSPGQSRRSQSPGRRNSLTPSSQNRRNSGSMSSSYQLMPMEMDSSLRNHNQKNLPRRHSSSLRRSRTKQEEEDEKYEAQVALVIQMAMAFFCVLISLATFLSIAIAIFTKHGYWVVIVLCVTLLITLVLSLCCFLYQVVNEDDAPSVNQRHMPKWYRTLHKMVKDELADFREDWMAMVNNMYLLEDSDGSSHIPNAATEEGDLKSSPQTDNNNNQTKPKKRKGKSAIFKLVAKPLAVVARFGRKRKEKRRQKKGQAAEPISFPSTMV